MEEDTIAQLQKQYEDNSFLEHPTGPISYPSNTNEKHVRIAEDEVEDIQIISCERSQRVQQK